MENEEYRKKLASGMEKRPGENLRLLHGRKLTLELEDGGQTTFTAGKLVRRSEDRAAYYDEYGGEHRLMSGQIETWSGHQFYALLSISVSDSGEHCGTHVFALDPRGGWDVFEQGTEEFDEWLKEMKATVEGFEFAPYRYMYRDYTLWPDDHHVSSHDGWSPPLTDADLESVRRIKEWRESEAEKEADAS